MKVTITNAPTPSLHYAVAETQVAMLLSIARRITRLYIDTIRGKKVEYSPIGEMGLAVRGKISGIIGLGKIGSKVAEIMYKGFNNKILYFGRSDRYNLQKKLGAKKVRLSDLFSKSDFIFVNIPKNSESVGLIKKVHLNLLKPTSIVISTSHPQVMDEKALMKLVKNKKIFGAGLDIYSEKIRPLDSHSMIITSHTAATEKDTTAEMSKMCIENVMSVLTKGKPINAVN